MAMRRRRRTTTKFRSKRAPWRETRLVESMLSGGLCISGLAVECTEFVLSQHFVFPAPNLPCNTLLAYPVLWTPDWQSTSPGPDDAAWKERIVHTHTSIDVTIQPNPLWLATISRNYQVEIQTGVPASVLIVPWKAAMFVYDDDEVISGAGLTSLFSDGWMETERYVPGTLRSGNIYHQSSVVEWQPTKVKVSSGAKRRLETGEGLYWVFEMGCVTANSAAGDISRDLFASFGGPFWLLGQFQSSYVE